ncbi:hypothetical protein [Streptococcus jiangjianxini]|uniref:hypothetical protein n=1 Tax=Streptococcus jiangjianxini TaxID=3161189 RepID=UPI0032EE378D
MEQLDYIKDSLNIKDPNITFEKQFDKFFTHREYHAKLDYDAPQCPETTLFQRQTRGDQQPYQSH